jgi:hypothetical protein
MDYATAKRRSGEIKGKKLRKNWDMAKKLAADAGVDTKQFNKGLGPAWDKFVGYIKGAAETNEFIPIDARSVAQMKAAGAKLDPIIKSYQTIAKRSIPQDAKDPLWVVWSAVLAVLGEMEASKKKALTIANKIR